MTIVLEDIFADKDLTKKQKSIKYVNAWLDLVRTVPRQHLLSDRQKALRNPKKVLHSQIKTECFVVSAPNRQPCQLVYLD